MKLSVVVPCFNEGKSINEFYKNLSCALNDRKLSHEIIMVDDGSEDDTNEFLKEINMEDKHVKVITFSRNFGKESAMLAGLTYASGQYVAIMDSDLQHKPSTLIEMYDKLLSEPKYDVVCAYKSNRMDEGSLKRTLTSIFYKVNNKISSAKLLPGASDFRVFKSCVKDAIISLPEKNRFLKGIFSWVGFNTIYVPYMPERRLYGTSKWSLFKLVKYSLSGIISFSLLPLYFIFILSLIIFIIGLFNFILMGRLDNKTIILFVSLGILFMGIFSLYISRMYREVLNRPCFIIKEKIGFDEKKDK